MRDDGMLVVELAAASVPVVDLVDAVVDVDEHGGVLGVEILGLAARHPRAAAGLGTPADATDVAVTYDPDADALYVRLASGRSVDQLVRPGAVVLGDGERLVELLVRIE